MRFKNFIAECHKREVFKMLSIYVVSSWVLLQVLAVTWEAIGLPHKSITYLIIALLAGFPFFLFWIGKYQVLPLWKKEIELREQDNKKIRAFHKIYFSSLGVITTICAISIFLIMGNTFSKPATILPIIQTDKIAVLKFGNNTGDSKYDIVGKMAADWVIHGITENHLGQVISQDVISQYNLMLQSEQNPDHPNAIIQEHLKPAKIISGNFYLSKDQLIFQSTISDEKTNKTLISFKNTTCSSDNPLDCVEEISESITGYLATSANKNLMLQEAPPKFEAYKYLLEAKNTDDNKEFLGLLNKALAVDPDFFEPKVLRVAYYYNQHQYKHADSLLKMIKPESHKNFRQVNLLNMYEAILHGENAKAYDALLHEYRIAPFDLLTNKTAMVLALQFVNKPSDVEEIYNAVKLNSINLQNCLHCEERVYVKALADIQLGKYGEAINSTQNLLKEVDSDLLHRPFIAAMIRSGKNSELDKFFFRAELSAEPAQLCEYYLTAGREYLLNNDQIIADIYFKKVKEQEFPSSGNDKLALAAFYLRDFSHARKEYEKLVKLWPSNIEFNGRLAISNYMLDNKKEAEKNLLSLEKLRGDYQFGKIDYALAQYYAYTKNEDEMYGHLLKSVAQGHLFISTTYQNDPIFRAFIKTEKFQEIIKYWL